MHPIIPFFQSHLQLSKEEIAFLSQHVPIERLEKGSFLLREGEVSNAFFFVVSGCIRMYYLVEGVEKTTFFYQPHEFVSSYESYTRQTPAPHFLQALENSQVARFDASVVAEIIQRFPRFEFLARNIMETELIVYQQMLAAFVSLNAEQRYLKLQKAKPALLQTIPLQYLATYLGVTPETLSRIRKRIQGKSIS